MKSISLALVAGLFATTAMAQTTTGPNTSATVPGATSNVPMAGVNPSTGTVPGAGMVDRNTGTAAASGDRNQAVATTDANAPHPAQGANSFSMSQARHRIAQHGFRKVAGLRKESGVWHGNAMKDGQPVNVWLDYKGNVGQD